MVRHTVLVGISQQIFALKFVIFQLIHLSFSGHTQFTEILHPLSSQLVLSDGHQMFYFALGQLNTIAINIDVEGPSTEWKEYDNFLLFSFQALIIHVQIIAVWKVHSSYTMSSIKMSLNIVIKYCYSLIIKLQGIFRHLDPRSGEMKDGLNPHVLERILQMCVVH